MRISASPRTSVSSLALACALAATLLPWVVFWRIALGHQTWAGGDISAYHYPLMAVSTAQWRHGRMPLWNPYLYGGTPLAAAQQASVFYPLNVLLWLLLPPWLMLGHSVLVHLSLAGLSIFMLLRSVKSHPLAALLGGIAFELSGFAMSHIGHVNIIRVLPWAGFTLWGLNRWADTRKGRYLSAVSFTMALLLLSGYPQVILYSSLLVFSYPLFMAIEADSGKARLFLTGLLALFVGVGLSGIQTVPTAHMWFTQEYLRPGEVSYEAFARFSFHPAYLATLLFPRARSGTFAEMVTYIGAAPLLLAIYALWGLRMDRHSRFRWFFAVWLVLALVLSMGRFVPSLSRFLFSVPIYKGLAVPSRHLLECGLCLAVLAGLGLDRLLRKPQIVTFPSLTWRKVALFVLLSCGWALLAIASPYSVDTPPVGIDPSLKGLGQPLLLLLAGLVLLVGVGRAKTPVKYALTLLLVLIAVVDLADFGAVIYCRGLTSPQFYTDLPPTATLIQQRQDGNWPFRVIAFEAQGNVMDAALAKDLLGANYNMAYDIESVVGLDGLMLRQVNQVSGEAIVPWGYISPDIVERPQFRNLLDLWGVRYLLVRLENATPLAQNYTHIASTESVSIFENEQARLRLFPIMAPEEVSTVSQTFGGQITLMDYFLGEVQSTDGGSPGIALFTWWSCRNPVAEDYTLYMHYVDGSGDLLAQDDHLLGLRLPGGTLPTSQWACPGYYRDVSYVPSELAESGELHVALGLWIPETGQRLVPSGGLRVDQFGRTCLEVGGLEQVEPMAGAVLMDEWGRMWIDSPEPSSYLETVRLLHYEGDRIGADVIFERDGILVHGTNYVSGWKAIVDDMQVPVLRVAGFLQGVLVPQGRHRVEFRYEPDSVKWGAAISAISLGVTAMLCLWPWRKRPGLASSASLSGTRSRRLPWWKRRKIRTV